MVNVKKGNSLKFFGKMFSYAGISVVIPLFIQGVLVVNKPEVMIIPLVMILVGVGLYLAGKDYETENFYCFGS